MTQYQTTVHIAGEMIGLLQRCKRCGEILTDYRDSELAATGDCIPVLSGWPVGGFIGQMRGCSVLMDHDAREIDEIRCGGKVQ